jgi:hypothetical protein
MSEQARELTAETKDIAFIADSSSHERDVDGIDL